MFPRRFLIRGSRTAVPHQQPANPTRSDSLLSHEWNVLLFLALITVTAIATATAQRIGEFPSRSHSREVRAKATSIIYT